MTQTPKNPLASYALPSTPASRNRATHADHLLSIGVPLGLIAILLAAGNRRDAARNARDAASQEWSHVADQVPIENNSLVVHTLASALRYDNAINRGTELEMLCKQEEFSKACQSLAHAMGWDNPKLTAMSGVAMSFAMAEETLRATEASYQSIHNTISGLQHTISSLS